MYIYSVSVLDYPENGGSKFIRNAVIYAQLCLEYFNRGCIFKASELKF